MTIAVFSLLSPQSPQSPSPKLGDKVYTTDDPGKVSTRRRRGSLLVGWVIGGSIDCINSDGGDDKVTVAMRRRVVAIPPP
jgi:hypothetical protein